MLGAIFASENPRTMYYQLFHHFIPEQETAHSFQYFEYWLSLSEDVYYLPNIIFPIAMGSLCVYTGPKRLLVSFSCIVLFGSFIVMLASTQKSIASFILGRFVFGLGTESLHVCTVVIIGSMFRRRHLAFSLAIYFSTTKFIAIISYWYSPQIANWAGLNIYFLFVCMLCTLSSVCSFCLFKTLDGDEVLLWQRKAINENKTAVLTYQLNVESNDNIADPYNYTFYGDANNVTRNFSKRIVTDFPWLVALLLSCACLAYGVLVPFGTISDCQRLLFYLKKADNGSSTLSLEANNNVSVEGYDRSLLW